MLLLVFTPDEAQAVLAQLDGQLWLRASLLYGSGLRLMECLRLRVKDLDFTYEADHCARWQRGKDRVTVLPDGVIAPLERHLIKVKALHEREIKEGYGQVYLPYALAQKYKNANRELFTRGCAWLGEDHAC